MSEHDGLRGQEGARQYATARLLAQGNYGSVKECGVGCTHLTFAAISLHFRNVGDFERFASEALVKIDIARGIESFPLVHRGTSLLLDPPALRALECLLKEGLATIQWYRGDLEFSDQDFRNLVDCQA